MQHLVVSTTLAVLFSSPGFISQQECVRKQVGPHENAISIGVIWYSHSEWVPRRTFHILCFCEWSFAFEATWPHA